MPKSMDEQILRDIIISYEMGEKQPDIAARIGMSQSAVSRILVGESYIHQTGIKRRRNCRRLKKREKWLIMRLTEYMTSLESCEVIAWAFECHPWTIEHIATDERFIPRA